jgi:hypothetical protein
VTLRRLTAAALALALSSTAASAQPESWYKAQIVEYGIYTAEEVSPATGINEAMKSARIKNICHVMTTTDIPARDYLQFGVRYRVDGPTVGEIIRVRHAIRFPNHMIPEDAPQAYVTNESARSVRIGAVFYSGWTNYKTRPGTWTFELFHEDRRLAGITFNMLLANEMRVKPDSHSTCFPVSSLSAESSWHST